MYLLSSAPTHLSSYDTGREIFTVIGLMEVFGGVSIILTETLFSIQLGAGGAGGTTAEEKAAAAAAAAEAMANGVNPIGNTRMKSSLHFGGKKSISGTSTLHTDLW